MTLPEKYLLAILFCTLLSSPLQASVWQNVFHKMQTKAKAKPTIPPLKKDIRDHPLLWTLSPTVSLLSSFMLGTLHDMLAFLPSGTPMNIIAISLGLCLMANAIVAVILASWPSVMTERGEKVSDVDILPFNQRLWRYFRFIGFTGLIPCLFVVLQQLGYLAKVLPKKGMKPFLSLLLVWWVYPCTMALIIAVWIRKVMPLGQVKSE